MKTQCRLRDGDAVAINGTYAYEIPFTLADAATTALCLDKGGTKVDGQISMIS